MTDVRITAPIVEALQSGNLVEAERQCRLHLREIPDDTDLLLLLGLALQRQGRPNEATEAYRRLTEVDPDNSMHWGNYATSLRIAGDQRGDIDFRFD